MFTFPALGSVIGLQLNPTQSVPSAYKSGEGRWPDAVEAILAENKENATDFAGLEETLAGHQTLRERLDDLASKVQLSQAGNERIGARNALENFCHSGDDSALRLVEWLFLQNPANRRSVVTGSQGSADCAKGSSGPSESSGQGRQRDDRQLFERLAGADRDASIIRQYVNDETPRRSDRREAVAMADVLDAVASGSVPSSLVPATVGPILTE